MATFFFLAVEDLAGYDVGLANFVNLATPQTPCAGSRRRRRPKMTRVATIDYDDPLEMQAALGGFIPRPVVLFCFITRKAWAVAAYFILVKLFVGILSSIAVLLSVVQPILAFASSGSFPCAGTGDTFQEDPVVYVSITTVLWMLGVVGIVVVPSLSVRLTAWACAEPEPEQQQQRVEVEQEGHEVAQMRSSEEKIPPSWTWRPRRRPFLCLQKRWQRNYEIHAANLPLPLPFKNAELRCLKMAVQTLPLNRPGIATRSLLLRSSEPRLGRKSLTHFPWLRREVCASEGHAAQQSAYQDFNLYM